MGGGKRNPHSPAADFSDSRWLLGFLRIRRSRYPRYQARRGANTYLADCIGAQYRGVMGSAAIDISLWVSARPTLIQPKSL